MTGPRLVPDRLRLRNMCRNPTCPLRDQCGINQVHLLLCKDSTQLVRGETVPRRPITERDQLPASGAVLGWADSSPPHWENLSYLQPTEPAQVLQQLQDAAPICALLSAAWRQQNTGQHNGCRDHRRPEPSSRSTFCRTTSSWSIRNSLHELAGRAPHTL